MIVRHGIEKLRGDLASQLRAQSRLMAARDVWSQSPAIQAMLADLECYGSGADLVDCSVLTEMMHDTEQAIQIAQSLVEALAPALSEKPLGAVPFRHNLTDNGASLMLASMGRAQLLLAERSPCQVKTDSAVFNPVERIDMVLSGSGRGEVVEQSDCGRPPIRTPIVFEKGAVFETETGSAQRALLVHSVEQSLVSLRLVRHPEVGAVQPTVQVSLTDGTDQHRAAATVTESRQEMALCLLGAMGRTDAAPVAAEMSREGPTNLRWQAVKQALAMDTATGFTELCAMAERSDDPLAPNAKTLRDQLIASHPVLGKLAA